MEEVTARVYLVSISRSRYSAVYVGGHAKTALLHAAISAAAHQMCEMLMNVQFRSCRDERSELIPMPNHIQRYRYLSTAVCTPGYVYSTGVCYTLAESLVQQLMNSVLLFLVV